MPSGRTLLWPTSLAGVTLPADLDRRRDEVARLLEARVGPVVHNPTRGLFLLPNAHRYGGFLREWATIYERFGVPAEIGLSQALVESGFKGTARSRARALGFCQWLQVNWNQLKRLAAPHVIEAYNQTTQAPYCAAYLTILATKYGSFIPALSEHHAGGTNVGRTLINGERLGGDDVARALFPRRRIRPRPAQPRAAHLPGSVRHLRPALRALRRDDLRQHHQRRAPDGDDAPARHPCDAHAQGGDTG